MYDMPEEQGALVRIVCSSGSRKKPLLRTLGPFVHTLCALLMGPKNENVKKKYIYIIYKPWVSITGLFNIK